MSEKKKCGRPTRKGRPCRITLRDGCCAVHDNTDLSARNAKAAATFRRQNPDAFRAQRQLAGRRGFRVTLARHGRIALEKAIEWRLQNPSEPERWFAGLLDGWGMGKRFVREYLPCSDRYWAVDFADPAVRLAIEINGHQHRPAFGEDEARIIKQKEKLDWLRQNGWTVLVIDGRSQKRIRAEQARQAEFFLGV